ncbi:hypothetical protein EXIGLDRAFT_39204 [Exidia glandulosa HHB12029]|uniref:Uncharacterized protein n=1 Tax=Exidia glandulosa HHB12029 TaxID=1314781 RepID=A0A165IN83_EXIGL|nr:hypothetical protein EXIGLDRAFT_39204 [Exidia glandulosa HHB12029]
MSGFGGQTRLAAYFSRTRPGCANFDSRRLADVTETVRIAHDVLRIEHSGENAPGAFPPQTSSTALVASRATRDAHATEQNTYHAPSALATSRLALVSVEIVLRRLELVQHFGTPVALQDDASSRMTTSACLYITFRAGRVSHEYSNCRRCKWRQTPVLCGAGDQWSAGNRETIHRDWVVSGSRVREPACAPRPTPKPERICEQMPLHGPLNQETNSCWLPTPRPSPTLYRVSAESLLNTTY